MEDLGSRNRFTANNGRWIITVSSQEESTHGDDMPTSIASEDESYQIGEHMSANF